MARARVVITYTYEINPDSYKPGMTLNQMIEVDKEEMKKDLPFFLDDIEQHEDLKIEIVLVAR